MEQRPGTKERLPESWERLYSATVGLALLVTAAASTGWASASPSGRRGVARRTVGDGTRATNS